MPGVSLAGRSENVKVPNHQVFENRNRARGGGGFHPRVLAGFRALADRRR